MGRNYDAVIVGAGPAGSSAAILLAQAGWHVAVVEKHAFPRRKVCGECISASNLPLLHDMGIGEQVLKLAGPPLQKVALMARNERIVADLPALGKGTFKWGVALGREYFDSLLLQRARQCGAEVFQPQAVRAVEGEPGGFQCEVEDMESSESFYLSAPVIIDAHGSWERSLTEEDSHERARGPADLFAFKANFSHTSLEPGVLPVLSFPGGYGGMVMADHGTATLAFCMRRDRLARCRREMPDVKAAEAAFAHVMKHCRGVRDALTGADLCGGWLAVGPLRPGIRLNDSLQPTFRIGNAAGEAHPIIGEGMSMAIQAAWLLAKEIGPFRAACAHGPSQRELRQHFHDKWKQAFAPRIRFAALFAHMAMRPQWFGGILPLLKQHPDWLTQAALWSGKARCAPLEHEFSTRLNDVKAA
jgi:2-polyprenyl-6-methoxyphenol hydroxylase-like FAD-dependent oxidoreductase